MALSLPMRSQLVAGFVRYVRARGGDADGLIRDCGLAADVETMAEVEWTLGELHTFLERAERASGDPFLGVHVAAEWRQGDYGVLEYACRSAATVGGALQRLSRYASLINDLIRVTVEVRDGVVEVDHCIPEHPLCVGRHANEFFVATMIIRMRALCDDSLAPRRVWFAHPAPTDCRELAGLLGTETLAFDCGSNGFAIDRDILARPLATSDPSLLSILDELAEARLETSDAGLASVIVAVRRHVRDRLSEGLPGIGDTAQALKLSPRTLQRRLADANTSYQAVVDDLRQELGRAYVGNPAMPLAEIAFLLGYGDVSSFLRAFKRWTGTTPSSFRLG